MKTGARFDWYAATFDVKDEREFCEHICIALHANMSFVKGRMGYSYAYDVERDDEKILTVLGGGRTEGEVHLIVTSNACDEVVPLLRRLWPEHRVTRADSAMDFVGEFEQIKSFAKRFADSRALKWVELVNSGGGATFSIGSRKSERYVRVYKKTEQLRQLHPNRADEIPDGVIRVELEFKPSKRGAKEILAGMSADDVWGTGRWTKELAESILGIAPERFQLRFKNQTDFSRSINHMGRQYSTMVWNRFNTHSPEEVFKEFNDAFDGLLEVFADFVEASRTDWQGLQA